MSFEKEIICLTSNEGDILRFRKRSIFFYYRHKGDPYTIVFCGERQDFDIYIKETPEEIDALMGKSVEK